MFLKNNYLLSYYNYIFISNVIYNNFDMTHCKYLITPFDNLLNDSHVLYIMMIINYVKSINCY